MPAASIVKVLAFAGARDIIGTAELELRFDEASLCASEVMDAVCRDHPALQVQRPHIRLAVNGQYVEDDAPVGDGDEVALIPPVAGG